MDNKAAIRLVAETIADLPKYIDGTPEGKDRAPEALMMFWNKQRPMIEGLIHPALEEAVWSHYDRGAFQGAAGDVQVIPTLGLAAFPYLVALGIGGGETRGIRGISAAGGTKAQQEGEHSLHRFRIAGVHAARAMAKHRLQTAVVCLPQETGIMTEHALRAMAEGILLGGYSIKSYRQEEENRHVVREVVFLSVESGSDGANQEADVNANGTLQEAMQQAIRLAEAYAEATNYARDLTNRPGNLLTPQLLAEEGVSLAKTYGMQAAVLDEQNMAEHGMGGLLAVGQGSANPPRMIVLKYQGRESWDDVLGLVGKGITFDTGGISLKKSEGMEEMISDMGGAAVILGVMQAAARLKLRANLLAVIPAAENMPSGTAIKPGDIITTMSGRTVEVLNTDAEGRIVLADGVTYAKRLGAAKLIDVATLTGAVLVSLGDAATAAVTNNDAFLQGFLDAAADSGEKVWQLPAYPEYWEMLKSPVADLNNAPGKWAAAITAGLFIGVFAEDTPWIHLDTGGTAWLWNEKGIEPKGGTGAMVRSILEWIRKQV